MHAWGLVVLRLTVAVVFAAHGLPTLVPVWGSGPAAAAAFGAPGLAPAYPIAIGAGLAEVLGSLALFAGLYTRWVAAALAGLVGTIAWKAHLPHGFFLNWALAEGRGHGYEYSLLMLGALVCLMLAGAGAVSIDGRRARFAEARAAGRARLLKSGN